MKYISIKEAMKKGFGSLVYRNPRSPHNGAHPEIWKDDEFALGGNAGLIVNPNCNVPVEKVREVLADARMTSGLSFAGEAMARIFRWNSVTEYPRSTCDWISCGGRRC